MTIRLPRIRFSIGSMLLHTAAIAVGVRMLTVFHVSENGEWPGIYYFYYTLITAVPFLLLRLMLQQPDLMRYAPAYFAMSWLVICFDGTSGIYHYLRLLSCSYRWHHGLHVTQLEDLIKFFLWNTALPLVYSLSLLPYWFAGPSETRRHFSLWYLTSALAAFANLVTLTVWLRSLLDSSNYR